VAVDPEPAVALWLDAYAAGLRVGLEHTEPEVEEPAESILAESVFGDALVQSVEDDLRARLGRLETQTYYQILGVPMNVEATALTSTYHTLTRRFHPDLFGLVPTPVSRDAGRLFRRINEAYAVLKEPRRRRLYDRGLAGPAHTWALRLTEEAEQQAQRQRRVRRGDTPLGQTYWKMAREVLERAREKRGEYSTRTPGIGATPSFGAGVRARERALPPCARPCELSPLGRRGGLKRAGGVRSARCNPRPPHPGPCRRRFGPPPRRRRRRATTGKAAVPAASAAAPKQMSATSARDSAVSL
jgi:hypothetical protein